MAENYYKNKTVFITGGSRGIGKAIALRLAKEGANIVIAAKSVEENPKLGGTIYSAVAEVDAAGGKGLAVVCDIRSDEQVEAAVQQAVAVFGGIDILVNNASAINLSRVEQTDAKRYDLMQDINVRGTFMVSKACLPYLKRGTNSHILSMSPPIKIEEKWFKDYTAYTVSKFGMSMVTYGLAAELRSATVASNTLWPKTAIATAAVKNLLGGDALIAKSRTPEIVADAAYYILQKPANSYTAQFLIDEDVLRQEGVTDFSKYAVVPGNTDFFDDFYIDN